VSGGNWILGGKVTCWCCVRFLDRPSQAHTHQTTFTSPHQGSNAPTSSNYLQPQPHLTYHYQQTHYHFITHRTSQTQQKCDPSSRTNTRSRSARRKRSAYARSTFNFNHHSPTLYSHIQHADNSATGIKTAFPSSARKLRSRTLLLSIKRSTLSPQT
jgi:hypothetical protein